MTHLRRRLHHPLDPRAEHGQTMTEYALIVTLVAVVIAAAVPGVAMGLVAFFTNVGGAFAP
jgi:Flp pilus assembly pilin Flp